MVVSGAEDLLTLAQRKPAVEGAQAHGGAVGHGEVIGLASEVLAGGGARGPLEAPDVVLGVTVRVFIEAAPVRVDGLLHRRRVGGEEEHRHVDPCRVQGELPAHLLPVGEIGRRLAGHRVVGAAPRQQRRSAEHGCTGQESATSHGLPPVLAMLCTSDECRHRGRGAVMFFSWPA